MDLTLVNLDNPTETRSFDHGRFEVYKIGPTTLGRATYEGVERGDGWSVANLDDLGEGPGFRKIRPALGVTAFGVNAVVIPPAIESGRHFHDEQEELYFIHQGELEFVFGEGDGATRHRLGPGGIARVAPNTVRQFRNVGDGDAVYICIGGKGGYVGRDGRVPEGEESRARPTSS